MAWGDPATVNTNDSELASALPVLYEKKVLEMVNIDSGLWDKLDQKAFQQRSGETAYFTKYAHSSGIDVIDGGVLTPGANPSQTDLVTGRIEASIVEYGMVVALEDLAPKVLIDGAEAVGEVVGACSKEAMEYFAQQSFAKYLQQVRVDGDSTYEDDSVTTTSGSTTLINDTERTEGTNALAGALVTIIDKNVGTDGESQYVASNVQNTSVTVGTAFSATIGAGVHYHISIPTAIAATDVLSLTGFRLAQRALRRKQKKGPGFEIPGGGYWGVYDADLEAQILADTNLLTLFTHTEKEASGIRNYDVGKIMMIRPELTSVPFQMAVTGGGTYSSTGVCHIMSIFGPPAGAVMPIAGSPAIQIITKGVEYGGPLNRFSTLGFKVQLALAKKNMGAGVALICGA